MGAYDRDCAMADAGRRSGRDWRAFLPTRGALGLIILHVLGFVLLIAVRPGVGPGRASQFQLEGNTSHPAAIVLHPIATHSPVVLALVLVAIWGLGGPIESRLGTGRLLSLYVCGNVLAGGVYFGFAQMSPDLAGSALAMPAGALAAWVLAAWRRLSDETLSVFGRVITVARAAAVGAAIVAGLVFFFGGPAATGWLIAAAAGSLAWPALNAACGHAAVVPASQRAKLPSPASPQSRGERLSPEIDDPAIVDILAKVSREGLDALTPAERDRLEAARRGKLRQSR